MKNSKTWMRLMLVIQSAWLLLICASSCGGRARVAQSVREDHEPAPWELVGEGESPGEDASEDMSDTLSSEPATELTEVPVSENIVADESKINIANADSASLASLRNAYGRLGDLGKAFNDSNKYQWAAGERIGIKPIRSLSDAYYLKHPLVKIETCNLYDVDPLTHSMPYLVPQAASLLESIGRNFADSLKRRGAQGHKFRVTSVLRTSYSVKKLRRVNRNATDSSTHQLATTFDISYAHFNYHGPGSPRSDEEMKLVLAEVLRDLRNQGKCLVKFERKSPCFHITATGK